MPSGTALPTIPITRDDYALLPRLGAGWAGPLRSVAEDERKDLLSFHGSRARSPACCRRGRGEEVFSFIHATS